MVKACSEQVRLELGKGRWRKEEDKILASYAQRFGVDNWRTLPKKAGLLGCGKSCRFRWPNYWRPGVKHGNYSKEEEEIIISLHKQLGNRWCEIKKKLPGRTDNEIRNYWRTHLKERSNKNQEMRETETQFSIEECETNAYEQLLILEDPGSDQMSRQSFSSNPTWNSTGCTCIMSKVPTKVVVDQFMQSATATQVVESFSSQSLLEESFSPQEPSPSTFKGLGLQFPLSPPSFAEYDYQGGYCNTQLDFPFNIFEGGEQLEIF